MDDDAVKNFIPFRVSAEEPLFEVGCIQSVVFGDFIAVRVDPFSTVDAGRDRIVFAMIMQLYPLNADRLVEAGNLYLRRVVRTSRPLADREAIAAPLHLLRDKVMTIFFFSIFRGVVCSKWRKFGHVSVSISKHAIINGAGGNLRRSHARKR